MAETKVGKMTIDIGFNIGEGTINTCLSLVEGYLDTHKDEELIILCNEPGNWDLGIRRRRDGSEEE